MGMGDGGSAARHALPGLSGTEPGIQAAPSVIISRTSALDTRIKPAYDEAESRQRLAPEPQFVIPTPP